MTEGATPLKAMEPGLSGDVNALDSATLQTLKKQLEADPGRQSLALRKGPE